MPPDYSTATSSLSLSLSLSYHSALPILPPSAPTCTCTQRNTAAPLTPASRPQSRPRMCCTIVLARLWAGLARGPISDLAWHIYHPQVQYTIVWVWDVGPGCGKRHRRRGLQARQPSYHQHHHSWSMDPSIPSNYRLSKPSSGADVLLLLTGQWLSDVLPVLTNGLQCLASTDQWLPDASSQPMTFRCSSLTNGLPLFF